MFARDRTFDSEDIAAFENSNQELEIKHLTAEELKVFEERTLLSNKKTRRVRTAFLLLISIPLSIGIYAVGKSLLADNPNVIEVPTDVQDNKREEFEFLVTDGDNWTAQQKWDNAIYQYNEALKIFPNDYIGNYRLARAYSLSCRENGDYCDEAELLLNKMVNSFPEKPNLYNFRAEFYLGQGRVDEANKDFDKVEELK